MSKHTVGPWKMTVEDCGEIDILSGFNSGDNCIATVRVGNTEANARLIAAAPEMLEELKLANKIIINALNVMTSEQKLAWDKLNTRDDLKNGLAVTRNHARESVIAKAESRS